MLQSHRPKVSGQKDKHIHLTGFDELPYYHRPQARKTLVSALVLVGITMVFEIAGGILSKSLALLSDAGHMLSHFFALGTSYAAIVIAGRKTSERFSYGFYRVEVLSALLNGLGVFAIAVFIFIEGSKRLFNPEPIETASMFWIALFGLAVNLITALMLVKIEHKDLNIKGAFIHMVADTASSAGVVLGAVIISVTRWVWVDALLSIAIAGLILIWAWGLIRDSVYILLESSPKSIDPDKVAEGLINSFSEIRDIHDLHIWEITSSMYSFTAHVAVDAALTVTECEKIRDRINHFLDERFDITHTNLQFESPNLQNPD